MKIAFLLDMTNETLKVEQKDIFNLKSVIVVLKKHQNN